MILSCVQSLLSFSKSSQDVVTDLSCSQVTAHGCVAHRAGALVIHHPAWVGHHTGGCRSTPTIHRCRYYGRLWVARSPTTTTTQCLAPIIQAYMAAEHWYQEFGVQESVVLWRTERRMSSSATRSSLTTKKMR